MNVLDRFEQGFERLLEGSVGRLLRNAIQPAEIGRKLERAMTANQVVSVDATLVPNDYRVAMHPEDKILFIDYISSLCRQMENWLAEVANERNYTLIDRVRVQIVGDEGVPRRSIQVTAAIAERPELSRAAQDELQQTEVYRVIRATGGVPPLRLRFLDGSRRDQEILLRKSVTTLGRSLDNDIVLEASEASRHHARLEFAGDQLQIIDLNSTNGTRVNGQRVTSQILRAGDELAFGSLKIKVLAFGANDA